MPRASQPQDTISHSFGSPTPQKSSSDPSVCLGSVDPFPRRPANGLGIFSPGPLLTQGVFSRDPTSSLLPSSLRARQR